MLRRVIVGVAAVLAAAGLAQGASAAPPPLEAYGKLPGVELAAVSPSGASYAVIGDVAGQRRLIVFDAETGKPSMTSAVEGQKIREITWAGEDRLLIHSTDAHGLGPRMKLTKYDIGQMLVLNVKTRENFWILTKGLSGNGVHGVYGMREEDGRWYGYFGGIKFGRSVTSGGAQFKDWNTDLYRVDLETNETRMLDENEAGLIGRTWAIGPGGGVEAFFEYDKRDGSWKIRAPRGPAIATGVDKLGDAGLAGLGRTPGTVIYVERTADGEDAWTEASLDGKEKTLLFRGIRLAEQFRDPSTGFLIGYRRDSDKPNLRLFDPDRQQRMLATQLAFPNLNVRLKAWNRAFNRLIVQTDGPGDAGTWWFVNNTTGRADEIGRSYPAVRSAEVGEVAIVGYKAADGLDISGVLTLPPGREAKNLPLVVLPHDLGGRDYPQFNWWAQAYASRGYAVFQPNFRGSEGYGAEFHEAGDKQWGRKIQSDISDGVTELTRRGIVDPKRACIVGASYGGYAALAGVTLQSGLYRCAVAVASPSDLPKMGAYIGHRTGYTGPGVRSFRDAVGDGEALAEISPARQAARADAPILLIHGKSDTVVPLEQSHFMERALRAAGKPVELMELEGEDHQLSREETRLAMLKASVAFVERYNPAD